MDTFGLSPLHTTAYGLEMDLDAAVGTNTQVLHRRMREMEVKGRAVYNESAKYITVRRLLVDWICEVGEECKLANSTMQSAVGLLDRFLQNMDVHRSRYQLVAMACFQIAAKYEEAEEKVPTPGDINRYASHVYSAKMVHQMEVLVLTRLNWALTVVTPSHFLGYFHGRGVLFHNDSMAYKPLIAKVPRYLKKYMDFFADLALQEYIFQRYEPSLLAAAIVMAARKALVIRPLWNAALEGVVLYSEAETVPVMCHIWNHYAENFTEETGNQDRQACEADRQAVASGAISPDFLPAYYSTYAASLANRLDASSLDSSNVSSQSSFHTDVSSPTQDLGPMSAPVALPLTLLPTSFVSPLRAEAPVHAPGFGPAGSVPFAGYGSAMGGLDAHATPTLATPVQLNAGTVGGGARAGLLLSTGVASRGEGTHATHSGDENAMGDGSSSSGAPARECASYDARLARPLPFISPLTSAPIPVSSVHHQVDQRDVKGVPLTPAEHQVSAHTGLTGALTGKLQVGDPGLNVSSVTYPVVALTFGRSAGPT